MAITNHQTPKPQNISPKAKKASFIVINSEFFTSIYNVEVPAPMGPRLIQIAGAIPQGKGSWAMKRCMTIAKRAR